VFCLPDAGVYFDEPKLKAMPPAPSKLLGYQVVLPPSLLTEA